MESRSKKGSKVSLRAKGSHSIRVVDLRKPETRAEPEAIPVLLVDRLLKSSGCDFMPTLCIVVIVIRAD